MSSPNSTTADVDARITKASDFARPICVKLREIIRKAAPNLEECLKWGMPAYKGNGLVCCIGAFKQHVTLHFFRGAEFGGAHALLKDGADAANSRGIKFTSLKEVKAAAVAGLVKEGVKIDGTEKTAKPKTKRAELPVPPAFTAALRKNPRAKKA